MGLDLGLEVPFVRPYELAQDDTPGLPVIKHAVHTLEAKENYLPDIIVVLQPTSPLRTSKHIDEALEIFLKNEADSLVSVTQVPHNMNPYSVMHLEHDNLKPFLEFDETRNIRQQKPKFYARNGAAIYICEYDCLVKKNSLFGDKTIPYFMKNYESVDLDNEWDWQIAELAIKKNPNNFNGIS